MMRPWAWRCVRVPSSVLVSRPSAATNPSVATIAVSATRRGRTPAVDALVPVWSAVSTPASTPRPSSSTTASPRPPVTLRPTETSSSRGPEAQTSASASPVRRGSRRSSLGSLAGPLTMSNRSWQPGWGDGRAGGAGSPAGRLLPGPAGRAWRRSAPAAQPSAGAQLPAPSARRAPRPSRRRPAHLLAGRRRHGAGAHGWALVASPPPGDRAGPGGAAPAPPAGTPPTRPEAPRGVPPEWRGASMSRPKPKPTPERWEQVRRGRLTSPAAGAGYQRARRALELGERIRHLREAQGISQAELGRRIGSTQPAIARLEAGRVSPTLETLDRVAAALEVELVVGFEDARRQQHTQARS